MGGGERSGATNLVQQLEILPVTMEEGKTGSRAAKQSRDMCDKVHMTAVTFLEGIIVDHIKLANLERFGYIFVCVTANGQIMWLGKDILPAALENVHAWPFVPHVAAHPFYAGGVTFDDEVLCRPSFLEICVNLPTMSACQMQPSVPYHSGAKADVEYTQTLGRHAFQESVGTFFHCNGVIDSYEWAHRRGRETHW
jgi:hypothetical protein